MDQLNKNTTTNPITSATDKATTKTKNRFLQQVSDLETMICVFESQMNSMPVALVEAQQNQLIREYLELRKQYEAMVDKFMYFDIENDFSFMHEIFNGVLAKIHRKGNDISISNANTLYFTEITKFNGKITEWPSFKNNFRHIVGGNKMLTKIGKLNILRKVVHGKTKELIKDLPVKDSSYRKSWTILKNLYKSKSSLFESLIHQIYDAPHVNSENVETIRDILASTLYCIRRAKTSNLILRSSDLFIARILMRKLDSEALLQYKENVKKNPKQYSLMGVMEFLKQLYLTRKDHITQMDVKNKTNIETTKPAQQATKRSSNSIQSHCEFCKTDGHFLTDCSRFAEKTISSRTRWVRRAQQCNICLSHKSDTKCYKLNSYCDKCKKNHHSLLQCRRSDLVAVEETHLKKLYPTAQIKVISVHGEDVTLRALLGCGVKYTSISEEAAKRLKLPPLKSIEDTTLVEAIESSVKLEIRTCFASDIVHYINALVIDDMDLSLPAESFITEKRPWHNYSLADPDFNISKRIDIIIGSDLLQRIIRPGVLQIKGTTCCNTTLGWFITGDLQSTYSHVLCTESFGTTNSDLTRNDVISENSSEIAMSTQQEISVALSTRYCEFCNATGHLLTDCYRFAKEPIIARIRWVKMAKQCTVCLLHKTYPKCYKINITCSKCDENHHTLFNYTKMNQPVIKQSSFVLQTKQEEKYLREVYPTAQIRVKSKAGDDIVLRALLGCCVQYTTITKEAVALLKLPTTKLQESLSESMVPLNIRPNFESSIEHNINAIVVDNMNLCLPVESFEINKHPWHTYYLADPDFNKSNRIDIIIGGDLLQQIVRPVREREFGNPNALNIKGITWSNTTLGWFITGEFYTSYSHALCPDSLGYFR